jgi:hypothetical protein
MRLSGLDEDAVRQFYHFCFLAAETTKENMLLVAASHVSHRFGTRACFLFVAWAIVLKCGSTMRQAILS